MRFLQTHLFLSLCVQFTCVRPHVTLLLLGSHSLADLRDAICCVSDLQVFGEFSNTPDMAPDFTSKVSRCTAVLSARVERLYSVSLQIHKEQVFAAMHH